MPGVRALQRPALPALLLALALGSGFGIGLRDARPPAPAPQVAEARVPAPPAPAPLAGAAGRVHNCRFWAAVARHLPPAVIEDDLVTLPYSLEHLAPANPNGWSVSFFPDGAREPTIRRGALAAHLDALYGAAVAAAVRAAPAITLAHVRRCSSGACDIPNPHPFTRLKHGRRWLMAHNGSIDRQILLALIRPDYLAANPPQHGHGPSEWIDSELYFLYILQTLEEHDWQVKPALGAVVQILRAAIPGNGEALNIALTEGSTLWAYREGRTLEYVFAATDAPYSAVASQHPGGEPGSWTALSDGQLVTLRPGEPPLVEAIERYFEPPRLLATEPAAHGAHGIVLGNRPNPFAASTSIEFELPGSAWTSLVIYDIAGRRVRELLPGARYPAGRGALTWDGTSDAGRAVPSGIYICKPAGSGARGVRRLVLLR